MRERNLIVSLTLTPNFTDPGRRCLRDFVPGDDFYEALVEAHRGLDAAESAALNARMILLLANQIGDLATLREAIEVARAG